MRQDKSVDPEKAYKIFLKSIGECECNCAKTMKSHAPDGRNYTNLEYVELRQKFHKLREFVSYVSSTSDLELDVLPNEAKRLLEDIGHTK